jgi:predicted transcriptional regulator
MPQREAQINLRVTEETKEKWDSFAKESRRVDGRSDLIRRSVTAYIARYTDGSVGLDQEARAFPENIDERLAAIEDDLSEVTTTVDHIDDGVAFIERRVVEDDEDTSFSDQLMRVVPPAKPTTEDWAELREKYASHPMGEPIVWEGTVEAITEALGVDNENTDIADESLVKQSLDALARQEDPSLKTDVVDGERRYWGERDLERQPFADGRMVEQDVERRRFRERQEGRK